MIDMSFAFIKVLMAGGLLMLPIILCSVVALAIILERAWFFYQLPSAEKADEMIALVDQRKFEDALSLSEETQHPVLRVLASGIRSRSEAPEKAMEATGVIEVSRLKKGLPSLDTIITLSPLLGLLGTIIGMIDSFGIMAIEGIGSPHAVTGGVAEALICTAGGITVAVLALIPYNYFLVRTERITEQIEHYATRNESALQTTVTQVTS
jgi:biopolymer transport protein ExbB